MKIRNNNTCSGGVLITLLTVLLISGSGMLRQLAAQQLPARSPFGANSFIWNPAMTAFEDYWEAGATHRQEWVGFEDAPQTSTLYGQYPFQKQNTSLGGYFMFDEINPIRTTIVAATYAYKIAEKRRRKGPRKSGQLSLGLSVMATQIFVDALDVVINDNDDPLVPVGDKNEMKPNVGVGLFYAGKPGGPRDASFFYAGLAATQLLASDFTFDREGEVANFKRALHGSGTIGMRAGGETLLFEPSLWFNFAGKNISDGHFNLRLEKYETMWAGLSYGFAQNLFFQAGYILPAGWAEDGTLRLGLMGSMNVGSFGSARGLGWEVYVAYRAR